MQELTYNAKHQLVGLTEHHHGKFKQRITFAYDALGRRIRKEVFTDETNANYTHAEHYVWRGQHQIQTRSFDKSKRCKHDQAVVYEPNSHAPLALIDSDLGLLDIDTDHLGTPKALYDRASGEELWRTDHDTYGALKNEHSNTQHPKTGKGFEVNIRFQGQYQDRETGLYYNFNRYYDPHAGRYINHDPIGLMGGLNQYQYCPNPVEWVDPLGLSCKENTWNAFQKDHKGQFSSSSKAAKAYKELKDQQSPWPIGYEPSKNMRVMQPGETFNMIVDNGKENMPGRFGTTDSISNTTYGRQNLAIKEEWKPTLDIVVTYKVRKPFTVFEGPVGPQIDGNSYLKGGGSQITFTDQSVCKMLDQINTITMYLTPTWKF